MKVQFGSITENEKIYLKPQIEATWYGRKSIGLGTGRPRF
jgi:hypothetical protein